MAVFLRTLKDVAAKLLHHTHDLRSLTRLHNRLHHWHDFTAKTKHCSAVGVTQTPSLKRRSASAPLSQRGGSWLVGSAGSTERMCGDVQKVAGCRYLTSTFSFTSVQVGITEQFWCAMSTIVQSFLFICCRFLLAATWWDARWNYRLGPSAVVSSLKKPPSEVFLSTTVCCLCRSSASCWGDSFHHSVGKRLTQRPAG